MTILQIFLIINAFLAGVAVALAVQYWIAHKQSKNKPTRTQTTLLSPAVRERLTKQAESNFQGIVNRSGLQLQHDLGNTGAQLNKLLEKFGSDVLDDEMKLFRTNVADIRSHTQASLSGAQDEITKQQTAILTALSTRQAELDERLAKRQVELEAELETSLATEKEQLTKRLETKLNDAVMAFLIESLGHEVDLGTQTDYLLATLEANKEQLVAGVSREA